MLQFAPGVKVYLACKPVDMRRGFDGLAADVAQTLCSDPYSGAAFVFRSKRGDYVKILTWDGSGLCLFAKRLEKGRLRARANPGNPQSRPYFAIAFAMKVGRFDFPADMIGQVSIPTRACRTAATGDHRRGRSLEKTIYASARNTPRARDPRQAINASPGNGMNRFNRSGHTRNY